MLAYCGVGCNIFLAGPCLWKASRAPDMVGDCCLPVRMHVSAWGAVALVDASLAAVPAAGNALPGADCGALATAAGDAAAGQGDQGGRCVQVCLLPETLNPEPCSMLQKMRLLTVSYGVCLGMPLLPRHCLVFEVGCPARQV